MLNILLIYKQQVYEKETENVQIVIVTIQSVEFLEKQYCGSFKQTKK